MLTVSGHGAMDAQGVQTLQASAAAPRERNRVPMPGWNFKPLQAEAKVKE